MKRVHWTAKTALVMVGAVALLSGCGTPNTVPALTPAVITPPSTEIPSQPSHTTPPPPSGNGNTGGSTGSGVNKQVAAKPDDVAVLVNKRIMLPDGYRPSDLVEPNVPFIFAEKSEKRLMRKEAAQALERLVAGAKKGGIHLAGVSGFRSYETQKGLFNYYVNTQGEEMARKYSAEPGHSEHQTGLAMDVSGSTGACAADDCFADTPEAKWLAQHAHEYGFIIRYPKGKERVTGYNYEPWHIRYVGTAIATKVAAQGQTLEEYFGVAG